MQGSARNSCNGKEFNTVDALVKHLKDRFAPGRNYNYYLNKITSTRMKAGDCVGDLYDKLSILPSSTRAALRDQLLKQKELISTQ